MPTSEVQPEPIHRAAHSIVSILGRTVGTPVDSTGVLPGVHPVFSLAQHHISGDGEGSDLNDASEFPTAGHYRGDHISIPCFTEDGKACLLEIGFHKGDTTVQRVDFPEASEHLMDAAVQFLTSFETR